MESSNDQNRTLDHLGNDKKVQELLHKLTPIQLLEELAEEEKLLNSVQATLQYQLTALHLEEAHLVSYYNQVFGNLIDDNHFNIDKGTLDKNPNRNPGNLFHTEASVSYKRRSSSLCVGDDEGGMESKQPYHTAPTSTTSLSKSLFENIDLGTSTEEEDEEDSGLERSKIYSTLMRENEPSPNREQRKKSQWKITPRSAADAGDENNPNSNGNLNDNIYNPNPNRGPIKGLFDFTFSSSDEESQLEPPKIGVQHNYDPSYSPKHTYSSRNLPPNPTTSKGIAAKPNPDPDPKQNNTMNDKNMPLSRQLFENISEGSSDFSTE